jgi:hypothetical protein
MDEYQIVERVKDWYRTTSIKADDNFLLNDRTIMSIKSYERLYEHNPSISKQVIGYINNDETISISTLEFPTLAKWYFISYAYLYKKGYVVTGDRLLGPDPLPNLKYVIYCISRIMGYQFQDKLVIELVDLDVVANNLNLPKIVSSVLGPKLLGENKIIEDDELDKIEKQMSRQKLFADYTWYDAELIVHEYFDRDERELSKEVLKISEAYERIFRPYRIVYDTKTWQPVLV